MRRYKTTISIITAVRNDVQNIARTMSSVYSQSFADIEYIIIDGASTDGTLDAISRSKDDRTIVISEPDKGVYDAMNKGIALSHGDWVLFMNSGDVFHDDNVLSDMVEAGMTNSQMLYYGNVKACYWDGDVIEKPNEFFKSSLKFKGIGICHQSMFFPGDSIRRMKYDLSYRIAADYDMALRMYNQGIEFHYIDRTIADYVWGNGISSNPFGLIPVYKENARVARQQWHPLYWCKLALEYVRLLQKRMTK